MKAFIMAKLNGGGSTTSSDGMKKKKHQTPKPASVVNPRTNYLKYDFPVTGSLGITQQDDMTMRHDFTEETWQVR